MTNSASQLVVDGLNPLQLKELQAVVENARGEIAVADTPKLGGGKVFEPTLLAAAITLSPLVISAVVVWLSKQRGGSRSRIKYKRVDANGTEELFEMDESSHSEGTASSAALEKFLEKGLGYDTSRSG